MNSIIRNILAVIVGVIIGGLANSAIITLSSYVIPPPTGANLTTLEGWQAAMPLLEPKHFIMPFIAHAFGVFVGSLLAVMIAFTHKMKFAIGIGVLFLMSGISMVVSLPKAPLWFVIVDLALAYIPMAYLGGKLAMRNIDALDKSTFH